MKTKTGPVRWPNRIADVRKLVRITQADLAKAIGSSQSCVSAYESGHKVPTVTTAARIRAALGCPILDPLETLAAQESGRKGGTDGK